MQLHNYCQAYPPDNLNLNESPSFENCIDQTVIFHLDNQQFC
jgi:hypothetical protein